MCATLSLPFQEEAHKGYVFTLHDNAEEYKLFRAQELSSGPQKERLLHWGLLYYYGAAVDLCLSNLVMLCACINRTPVWEHQASESMHSGESGGISAGVDGGTTRKRPSSLSSSSSKRICEVRPGHSVASAMASHPLPMTTSSMTYDLYVNLFAVVLPRPRPLSLPQSPSTPCPMRSCPPYPPSSPSIKCSLRAHDDCSSATADSFALSPS